MEEIFVQRDTTTHWLIKGDVLDVLDQLPKESVDLVFVDPPYNIGKGFEINNNWKRNDKGYIEWCKEWILKIHRLLAPNGSFYLMAATQYKPFLDIYVREQFTVLNRIVWCYDSSGVQAKTRFGSLWESILLCVKNKNRYTFNYNDIAVPARTGAVRKLIDYRKGIPERYNNKRNPGNVWYFPRVRFRMPEYMNHPSQKPELLLERIILTSSNIGDTVLDPFAGTFTANVVAVNLRRNSIGIEINDEYFQEGVERLRVTNEKEEIANRMNYGKMPQAVDLSLFTQ